MTASGLRLRRDSGKWADGDFSRAKGLAPRQAGIASDARNLTPNPFPNGKGDKKSVGIVSSYPPGPLSTMERGSRTVAAVVLSPWRSFHDGKGGRLVALVVLSPWVFLLGAG